MHAMCSASYALKKQSRRLLTETDDVLAYSVRWTNKAFQPGFRQSAKPIIATRIPLPISTSHKTNEIPSNITPGLVQSVTNCCNSDFLISNAQQFFRFYNSPCNSYL